MKKPSESLKPGALQTIAKMSLDPLTVIITIVAGLAQGITKAVLDWKDKRKAKKVKKDA